MLSIALQRYTNVFSDIWFRFTSFIKIHWYRHILILTTVCGIFFINIEMNVSRLAKALSIKECSHSKWGEIDTLILKRGKSHFHTQNCVCDWDIWGECSGSIRCDLMGKYQQAKHFFSVHLFPFNLVHLSFRMPNVNENIKKTFTITAFCIDIIEIPFHRPSLCVSVSSSLFRSSFSAYQHLQVPETAELCLRGCEQKMYASMRWPVRSNILDLMTSHLSELDFCIAPSLIRVNRELNKNFSSIDFFIVYTSDLYFVASDRNVHNYAVCVCVRVKQREAFKHWILNLKYLCV